ncbi:unnamed protein product [Chrysoparadoxa australica]
MELSLVNDPGPPSSLPTGRLHSRDSSAASVEGTGFFKGLAGRVLHSSVASAERQRREARRAKEITFFIDTEKTDGDKWVIDGRSAKASSWTWGQIVAILISTALVPFQAAFRDDLSTAGNGACTTIDMVLTVLFALDIVWNFNTSYVSEQGEHIAARKEIACHYLKGWFIVDFLGTFPWWLLPSAGGASGLLRLFKLARMGKAWRVMGGSSMLEALEAHHSIDYNRLRLARLALAIGLIGHVLGCFLFVSAHGTKDADECEDNFYCVNGLESMKIGDLWVYGVYWAVMTITTIGYGDVALVGTGMRLYAILTMAVGASVFAFVVGEITGLISASDEAERQRQDLLGDLNSLMANVELPKAGQDKIRYFVANTVGTSSTQLSDYQEQISKLSAPLAGMLVRHVHSWLKHVPFLRIRDAETLVALAMSIEERCFTDGDQIIRRGGLSHSMFVVRSGAIKADPERRYGDGNCVGLEILEPELVYMNYTVEADGFVEVYKLTRGSVWKALAADKSARLQAAWARMTYKVRLDAVAKRQWSMKEPEGKPKQQLSTMAART